MAVASSSVLTWDAPKRSRRQILFASYRCTFERIARNRSKFVDECVGDKVKAAVAALKPGEVLLLENLRFHAEEEGKPRGLAEDASDEEKAAAKKAIKASQKEFTKELADLADVYVNDAFGTAHRAHASTALMAEYFSPENKMFGYLMGKEVAAVDKVMKEMVRPFTAIMGGSKVSSKIDIIENLLTKVDNLIIAGGMTYTLPKHWAVKSVTPSVKTTNSI